MSDTDKIVAAILAASTAASPKGTEAELVAKYREILAQIRETEPPHPEGQSRPEWIKHLPFSETLRETS